MSDDDDISIINGQQWTKVAESEFAQVIFQDVPDWYSTDDEIKCYFIVSKFMKVSNEDKVGLYKVGWNLPSAYITFEDIPDQHLDLQQHVVFPAKNLPKDETEFYQFCYFSSNDEIRGASTPFRFKYANNDNLVTCEEDSDDEMMVVMSKSAAMQKKMNKIEDEKSSLLKEKLSYVKEKEDLKEKVAWLENELKRVDAKDLFQGSQQNFHIQENIELKSTIEMLKENLRLYKKKYEERSSEFQRATKSYLELQKQVENGEIKMGTAELMKSMESQIYKLQMTINKQKDRLEQASKLAEKYQSMYNDVIDEEIPKMKQSLGSEINELQKSNSQFQDELSTASLLNNEQTVLMESLEKEKNAIDADNKALKEFSTKLQMDLEEERGRAHNYKQDLKNCQVKLEEKAIELEACKTQMADLEDKGICLKTDRDVMEHNLNKLEAKCILQESHAEENEELKKALASINLINKTLDNKMKSAEGKVLKSKQEASSNSCLRKQLTEGEEEHDMLKAQMSDLQDLTKIKEEEILMYWNKSTEQEKCIKKLEQKINMQEDKLSALLYQVQERDDKIYDFEQQIICCRTEYKAKYRECEKQKKMISKMVECKESSQRKSSMCSSMSSLTHVGSLTPAQQTLSAAISSTRSMARSTIESSYQEPSALDTQGNDDVPLQRQIGGSNLNGGEFESFECIDSFFIKNSLKCPRCSMEFLTTGQSTDGLLEHLFNVHSCRTCPICGLIFEETQPEEYFISHVHTHFNDTP